MGESQQLSCQENVREWSLTREKESKASGRLLSSLSDKTQLIPSVCGSVPAFSVSVAAWWMLPVAHLPIADQLIGMHRINVVAPSLGACWNINVTKALLALLDYWKDAISKLINSIGVKGNGVEL